MNKKGFFILITIILILASITIIFVVKNKEKEDSKRIVTESIENYLYKNKKYKKEEISKINIIFDSKMDKKSDYYKYIASVYYKDEPENEYIYYVNKNTKKVTFISIGNESDIKPSHEKLE